ncbi:MAG: hypothetical protein HKN79_03665, partial [Flavobacteriales bacterium]|nr:hypothetical protein [Flavobacteriales bacterium]
MITSVNTIDLDNLDQLQLPTSDVHIVFASRDRLEDATLYEQMKSITTDDIIFVSTAGQIHSHGVNESDMTVTSIKLERSEMRTVSLNIDRFNDYSQVGMALFNALDSEDLKGIIVFSDGTSVNGSNLKKGLERENNGRLPIAGGLAGDGARFEKTLTGINEAKEGNVVGIGLYGDNIHLGYGSRGGWQFKQQMNIISDSD